MDTKKLKVVPYNKNFPKIFEEEKKKISKITGNNDIYHIGSTAVPGLGGKGIIDIMIGMQNWKEAKNVVRNLKSIGFKHVHPKEQGRIFLSKHKKPTPDNVHIHIVEKGSKQCKELLAFRNYLRRNKKEVERFLKLKLEYLKQAKEDRNKYNKLKEKYVKEILNKVNVNKININKIWS